MTQKTSSASLKEIYPQQLCSQLVFKVGAYSRRPLSALTPDRAVAKSPHGRIGGF